MCQNMCQLNRHVACTHIVDNIMSIAPLNVCSKVNAYSHFVRMFIHEVKQRNAFNLRAEKEREAHSENECIKPRSHCGWFVGGVCQLLPTKPTRRHSKQRAVITFTCRKCSLLLDSHKHIHYRYHQYANARWSRMGLVPSSSVGTCCRMTIWRNDEPSE